MGRPCAPIEVAQGWVEALEESDFDEVMRLYAPRATLIFRARRYAVEPASESTCRPRRLVRSP
jgi:ketosteroid isomerase-like protein